MTVSSTGFEFIRIREQYIQNAYEDKGKWYVGYGNHYYQNKTTVQKGDTISLQGAENLLRFWVNEYGKAINKLGVKLTQGQFDALVSYMYNRGPGTFAQSVLRKMVLANPNDSRIPEQFVKEWGIDLALKAGLIRRRQLEAQLYISTPEEQAGNSIFLLLVFFGLAYFYYQKSKKK